MSTPTELLDTCTVNLKLVGGQVEIELLHTVRGSQYAYRARASTLALAVDKFAELHNAMIGQALGFNLVPPP